MVCRTGAVSNADADISRLILEVYSRSGPGIDISDGMEISHLWPSFNPEQRLPRADSRDLIVEFGSNRLRSKIWSGRFMSTKSSNSNSAQNNLFKKSYQIREWKEDRKINGISQ